MPKQLLVTISFVLDARPEHFDKVRENLGRAYAYTLSLLGAKDVEVLVQTNPVPYEKPGNENKRG